MSAVCMLTGLLTCVEITAIKGGTPTRCFFLFFIKGQQNIFCCFISQKTEKLKLVTEPNEEQEEGKTLRH